MWGDAQHLRGTSRAAGGGLFVLQPFRRNIVATPPLTQGRLGIRRAPLGRGGLSMCSPPCAKGDVGGADRGIVSSNLGFALSYNIVT